MNRKWLWLIIGLALYIGLIGLVLTGNEESKVPGITTPIWRGIVPGKAKQWDVLAMMGKPDEIRKCSLDEDLPQLPDRILRCFSPTITYVYKEVRPLRGLPATHEIRFRYATVWAIVVDVWRSPDESSPELLGRFVKNYGQPERVTWSKRSPHVRAFLFCQHGVMVHANDVYATEVFYFVPVPLNECLNEFKDDVATEDPFPNPGFPSIEDPWPWLIPND